MKLLAWPFFVVFLSVSALIPGAVLLRADQQRASSPASICSDFNDNFPVSLGIDGRVRMATLMLVRHTRS